MPRVSGDVARREDGATLGARVRELRGVRGLTQSELAHGRCSKEYVSQIERGASRPTGDTLEWLAERLGTDRAYLEHGVSGAELARAEDAVRDGGRLLESHRY